MIENPEYQGLPSFLFGQSMGGAVALKVHFEQSYAWDGAVLVAPMCKVNANEFSYRSAISFQSLHPNDKIFPVDGRRCCSTLASAASSDMYC